MALPINYTDDVFEGNRKYTLINNTDGTISLVDVTEYSQEGSPIGAAQINAITGEVNAVQENLADAVTEEELTSAMSQRVSSVLLNRTSCAYSTENMHSILLDYLTANSLGEQRNTVSIDVKYAENKTFSYLVSCNGTNMFRALEWSYYNNAIRMSQYGNGTWADYMLIGVDGDGRFGGQVKAPAGTDYTEARMRNAVILAKANDPGHNASVDYPNGTLVLVRKA